jgi:uncharacterized damage-inducible protein DinB
MATKAIQQSTISERLITRWEQSTEKLATLAEEFPESKFHYAPAKGVRTVSDVLRHVAFWNFYVADRASEKKADDTGNELSKDQFSTKKQILDALKRSSSAALKGLNQHRSGFTPEIAEMLVTFIEHTCEHYGQLVVYARLNGIVPPSSRG